MDVLRRPLTREELIQATDNGIRPIKVVIPFDITKNGLHTGIESFNDALSLAVTGTEVLQDISYRQVGSDPERKDGVLLEVSGDVSGVLEFLRDE